MPLAAGDVIAVSFRGTLFGTRILNILHYVVNVPGTGTPEAQLQQVCDNIQAGAGAPNTLKNSFLNMIAVDYTLTEIRAQRVYPTRTVYKQAVSGDVGQYVPATCTAPNVAISMLKQTNTPGRMGIGRIQLGGVPSDAYVSGVLDPATTGANFLVLKADILSNFTTSTTLMTMNPCLFNPTAVGDKFSLLTGLILEDTIRVMHRRTLRVGE